MSDKIKTWKDETTYSRYDKESNPSVWHYNTGKITVILIKNHIDYPGKWLVKSYDIKSASTLTAPIDTPLETVQEIALRVIKKKLNEMIDSLT